MVSLSFNDNPDPPDLTCYRQHSLFIVLVVTLRFDYGFRGMNLIMDVIRKYYDECSYVNCNNRKVGKPGNEARRYMPSHARTPTHTHTHTHTHAHKHALTHIHACSPTCTLTRTHKHTRVHESTLIHHSYSGVVDVFGVDDSTGMWLLSHTLQFTRRQFPGKQIPAMCSACFKFQHSINVSDSNDSNLL